jgi:hypothetical protein
VFTVTAFRPWTSLALHNRVSPQIVTIGTVAPALVRCPDLQRSAA